MPSNIISELLTSTEELKALTVRTRRLRELQTLYLGSAPRELAGSSRVKSYKAGTLCVAADNGVVAAKLKQLAPTLLSSIQKNDAEITALRIEVQVSGNKARNDGERPNRALPVQALRAFEALSREVCDGRLKLALANLVQRHRTR